MFRLNCPLNLFRLGIKKKYIYCGLFTRLNYVLNTQRENKNLLNKYRKDMYQQDKNQKNKLSCNASNQNCTQSNPSDQDNSQQNCTQSNPSDQDNSQQNCTQSNPSDQDNSQQNCTQSNPSDQDNSQQNCTQSNPSDQDNSQQNCTQSNPSDQDNSQQNCTQSNPSDQDNSQQNCTQSNPSDQDNSQQNCTQSNPSDPDNSQQNCTQSNPSDQDNSQQNCTQSNPSDQDNSQQNCTQSNPSDQDNSQIQNSSKTAYTQYLTPQQQNLIKTHQPDQIFNSIIRLAPDHNFQKDLIISRKTYQKDTKQLRASILFQDLLKTQIQILLYNTKGKPYMHMWFKNLFNIAFVLISIWFIESFSNLDAKNKIILNRTTTGKIIKGFMYGFSGFILISGFFKYFKFQKRFVQKILYDTKSQNFKLITRSFFGFKKQRLVSRFKIVYTENEFLNKKGTNYFHLDTKEQYSIPYKQSWIKHDLFSHLIAQRIRV